MSNESEVINLTSSKGFLRELKRSIIELEKRELENIDVIADSVQQILSILIDLFDEIGELEL